MIDTHCHLNLSPLYEDRQRVITQARIAGVRKILVPAVSLETSYLSVEVSNEFEEVYAVVGVHPLEELEQDNKELKKLLTSYTSIVAVGEVGLDFSRDSSNKATQYRRFEEQISLAQEFLKPLIIHSRDAYKETANLLSGYGSPKAAIHCFTGTYEEAVVLLDLGCYLSVTGILTYRSSNELREIVAHIPLDRLMIETDAPYLAPQGQRGKSNEPAFLGEIAEELAKIHHKELQYIISQTSTTAEAFFKLNKNQTVC